MRVVSLTCGTGIQSVPASPSASMGMSPSAHRGTTGASVGA